MTSRDVMTVFDDVSYSSASVTLSVVDVDVVRFSVSNLFHYVFSSNGRNDVSSADGALQSALIPAARSALQLSSKLQHTVAAAAAASHGRHTP